MTTEQTTNKNFKARNWCFTIFEYDDGLIEHLKSGLKNAKHCVFQEEISPTTGRKHLQGHIIWNCQKTMSACKKALNSKSCHLEIMRGTPQQSALYCTKDETSTGLRGEYGQLPIGQGHRSDLEECVKRIQNGELKYTDLDVEYPQLFVQYRNGLREICDKYRGTKRTFKSNVSVFYGKSGTGKSMKAFADTDDYYVLRCSKTGIWFDGYEYNNTLVIDDFYGWLPFNFLLNLLDRYAMKVDVKGGAMEFNSPNIIITSNKSPLDWYPNLTTEHKIALLRRIDNCVYFDRTGSIDVSKGLDTKLQELKMTSTDDDEIDELVQLTHNNIDASKDASRVVESAHCSEVPQGNTILSVLASEQSSIRTLKAASDCTITELMNAEPTCKAVDTCEAKAPKKVVDTCEAKAPKKVVVEWDEYERRWITDDGLCIKYLPEYIEQHPEYKILTKSKIRLVNRH